jgi:hypothetical protein
MVSNEKDLKEDVREFTGYTSIRVLSHDGLDTAYRTAQRHIRVKKNLDADYDWFETDKPGGQEALFWYTCLFSKVQTGELDSQDLQAGAVDQKTLLAKADDDVTTWYRNAKSALKSIKATSIVQSTAPSRTNREYEPDSFGDQSGGSTTDVGGSDL